MKTFKQYFKESETKPTTKKFKFFVDNPGGEWLEHDRERAKGSKMGGSVTGGFHETMQIPTKFTKNLRGLQGEHNIRKITDPDVQKLMKAIKAEGIYEPIFINVHWDGEAWINEGNRRAMIARALGMKTIPVNIRYFAGGERVDGPWHPDSITKFGKPWKRPKKPASIRKAEREMELYRIRRKKEQAAKDAERKAKAKKAKPEKPVSKDMQDILDLLFNK
jgi:hypothetical protein